MRVVFLGEGSSDNGIAPHIETLAAHRGIPVALTVPDLSLLGSRVGHAVPDKLRAVRGMGGGYDLAVVHRDADRGPADDRFAEIREAVAREWPGLAHVPAVPVRMLEAWLLLDEAAIRRVAENPNGKVPLNLPKGIRVEQIADPKAWLKESLAQASELKGRRLEQFQKRFSQHRLRLLELLDPRGTVLSLPSWRQFVTDLESACDAWSASQQDRDADPSSQG